MTDVGFVPVGSVFSFATETMEVTENPASTGDRYRIRVTCTPGGGPGIRGDGPHTHPGLVEIFSVVSGRMTVRLARDLTDVEEGGGVEVAPGVVHGFVNPSDADPLVVDVQLLFEPPVPRETADAARFAQILSGLLEDGAGTSRTGYPPWSQMALLLRDRFPEAMAQPGLVGLLMGPLAAWGRVRGRRTRFPEYEVSS